MTDLSTTMTALQLLVGLKFYEVEVLSGVKPPALLRTKSMADYSPGELVVMQHRNLFPVVKIIRLCEMIDIEEEMDCSWLLGPALQFNPLQEIETMKQGEVKLKAKIAQAKALTAAKEILNAAGLSLSDISALIGGKTDAA